MEGTTRVPLLKLATEIQNQLKQMLKNIARKRFIVFSLKNVLIEDCY